MDASKLKRRNLTTAVIALAVVAGMVGFAFASVPLYRVVCKRLGIGGTTQRAEAAPQGISDVDVTVRFDANIDKELPWEFKPNQPSVTLKLGESKTISYHVRNKANYTTVGSAEYNVTPDKVGQYFNKLQCFCFQEQTLAPGQEEDLAVTFYVDPAMLKDSIADEVRTITLSYTFFRAKDGLPADTDAVEPAGAATISNVAK